MRTIAGFVLVGLVGFGDPLEGAAVEVKVKLSMAMKGCEPGPLAAAKVNYRAKDVLLFSFANECPKAQEVFVCVKDATGTTYGEPWHECVGLPSTAPATAGKQFKIDAAPATAHALCTVKWPDSAGNFKLEKFALQVFSADSGNVKCPRSDKDLAITPRPRSELALDVEP